MVSCIVALSFDAAAEAAGTPTDREACAAAEAAFRDWSPGWKGQAVVAALPVRGDLPSAAEMSRGWSDGAPSAETVSAYFASPPRSMLTCPNVAALARASGHPVAPPEAATRPDARPATGLTRLSLPVLARREALVEVVHTGQRHGGAQQFMLLRKTPKGWAVVSYRSGLIG